LRPKSPQTMSGPETLLSGLAGLKTYPVMDWHPALCGTIDIRIDAEGRWWHEGAAIGRQSLVDLFAQLLRKEGDDYFLVTPVEKLLITVEDLPLRLVDIEADDNAVQVATGQGEVFAIGPGHELAFDGDVENPLPRVRVRHDLWARFSRPAYYRLMQLAVLEHRGDDVELTLAGQTFALTGR
jgi:uncharacterized protein